MTYHVINTGSNNSNNNNNNNNPNNNNGGPSNTTPNVGGVSSKQAIQQSKVPEALIDYYELAKDGKIDEVMFREKITQRLLTTLTTKNHPNALLVGDAGTGKTAIVEDLAVKLYHKEPIVSAMLGDETRIYELPLTNLVAGSSMFGALEAKLQDVVDFISDPKNHAILYIDEIHQLTNNSELKKVGEILKPALARGDMHAIGATTTQELKFWQNNPALTRRFSNIIVNELSDEQTIEILKKVLPSLQKNKTAVQVDASLLETVVNTGNQYAKTLATHRPDSAITVLDQALSTSRLQSLILKQQNQISLAPKLTKATIEKAGQQLINHDGKPVDNNTVNDLKAIFANNIIGQEDAKAAIQKAVQSMALNLTPQTKPHSFLFAGLTGTGKTEIAKQLAKALFNTTDDLIYLNMTEYAHDASLTRLIGSSRGFVGSDSAQPLPLDGLKSNPFQIVLLDEFEKAAPTVQRIFMQALDEGSLQYADGSTVDFSHAIVIATTNAGTQHFEQKSVGFTPQTKISTQELNQALQKNFPPELLNRFENVVSFNKINQDEYAQVLTLKYNQLRQQIEKSHPEFKLEPKEATTDMKFIQKLVKDSYDPMKNGRPAQRSVQQFVEQYILDHTNTTQFDFNA